MSQKSVNFRHTSSSFSFYIESEIEGRKKRCFDDGYNDDSDNDINDDDSDDGEDGEDGDDDGNDDGNDDALTRFNRLLSLYFFREMLIFCSRKKTRHSITLFPTFSSK